MICYKDMTFCSFYEDCDDKDCSRALTQEVRDKADKLGLPICQFMEKPDCWLLEKMGER